MAKSQLTLVQREDAVHVYWHEQHGYWLSDWQPVFKKGVDLKRAYQACIDAALTRRGAPWLADASKFVVIDPGVSKMSANRSVEKVLASGRFEITAHATREQAEAAVLAWLEKNAKR